MAIGNIKLKAQEEDLSDVNIRRVIELLEPKEGKSCTKKHACEVLRISYNVSRLDKIITKYKEQQAFRDKKLAENRGKPASKDEIEYVVKGYIKGDTVAQLAKDLFRGPTFINSILDSNDVPRKPRTQDYFKPELIPDSAVRNEFAIGEKVYSARYDSLAMIKGEYKSPKNTEKVYSIYLIDEKWNMYAYQPASELASLDKFKELGINI